MNYATCIRRQGPLAEKVARLHKERVAAGLIRDDAPKSAPVVTDPIPHVPQQKRAHEKVINPRATKIGRIQAIVCEHYDIAFAQMIGHDRRRRPTWARQVAMAVARNMTSNSTTQIGRAFERDHTTVVSGCRVVEERTAANPHLCEELREIMAKVHEALAQ